MLIPYMPTCVWVLINLLILYFVLRKLLFKPVTKFMEDRASSIEQSINNAQARMREADELKKDYENHLKSAHEEADRILVESRRQAEKEYASLIDAAKVESETIISRAHDETERERQQMKRDLKDQIASLALAAASKILEANMDTETNRAIVDKFIDEEGAA